MTTPLPNGGVPPAGASPYQIDTANLDRIEEGEFTDSEALKIIEKILDRCLAGTAIYERAKRIKEKLERGSCKEKKPEVTKSPKLAEDEFNEPPAESTPNRMKLRKI